MRHGYLDNMMATAPALQVNPTLSQRLSSLDRGQRMRLGLGVVLFVAVAIAGMVMGRQAEWRVLYANLADKDGGAIIAQLSQMNIPYQHAEGGGAILVPADRVHDARLKLAAQGLPRGAVAGFEAMESNRFGMTQFQERLTFQRGLEGELTRTIQALSSVQSARVHLALPNQNGFFREQQKPSASVLLTLNAGRVLDRTQVAGIVHLVASSVPDMNPSAVSVLDETGKLLSKPADEAAGAAGDAQQLQYAQQLEQLYTNRIIDILAPVVGRQNIKAQVAAELDFSQTESTSELHKPNQTPDTSAVRSQQTVESLNGSVTPPTGVPGASSNQPPSPTTAPINNAPQAQGAAGSAANSNTSSRRESVINYEVDRTVRVVRGASATVKRLSAAVVINHQTKTDAKGKVTTVPMSAEEIEKMTALVRETIGFSKDRGDSVNLMNAPFTVETQVVPDLPVWKQPELQDLARSFAWPVGTLMLAAMILMGFIRPAMKVVAERPVVMPASAGAQLDALEAEEPERALLPPPKRAEPTVSPGELALEDARKLTRDNPAAVASIVKGWINGEAAA